jgi:DNA-binding NtrC family response regulator
MTSSECGSPGILVVTPDDRVYTSLLYVSTEYGWITRWARSVECATGILRSGTNSIILYDCYSKSHTWQEAVDRFLIADAGCCIVLAVPDIDEQLWLEALRHRIYDVVPRAGRAGDLAATLRFAWRWKCERAGETPSLRKMTACP